MSEFVECQNCGRTFFAENLDCPYCGGDDDPETLVAELMRTVAPNTPDPPRAHTRSVLFAVLFHGFTILVAGILALAVVGLVRARTAPSRVLFLIEIVLALATLAGMLGQRRWGRVLAILFIVWNAGCALWPMIDRDAPWALGWGPAPIAILLFLWPFFGTPARERFAR